MSVPSDKYGEVVRLTYTKADDNDPNHPASAGPKANGMPVLRVHFEYGGGTHRHDVPNGDFTLGNPALQILAYLALKPSDFDGQTLEPSSHVVVPVVRDGEESYALSNTAIEMGSKALENVAWSPNLDMRNDDDSDDTASHSGGSGGGGDGGGGSSEIAEVETPEGVEVENNEGDDGLTVNVE